MKKPKTNKSDANKGKAGGKGDAPRSCFSEEFKHNFQRIDWSRKKIEMAPSKKIDLYPENVHELVSAVLGEDAELGYLVTDGSTIGDFIISKTKKILNNLKKIEKKYQLKELESKDLLWEIAKKMHDFRPL